MPDPSLTVLETTWNLHEDFIVLKRPETHLPLVEVEETPAIGVFVHPLFRRIFGDVLRPIENYRIFLGGHTNSNREGSKHSCT